MVLGACLAVTVTLGVIFAGQTGAGWLDSAVDARAEGRPGMYPALLEQLARPGEPRQVTMITVALVLACAVARRWRDGVLVAVAVSGAAALTEFVLKPAVGRTLHSALSFPSGHATSLFALAASCAVLLRTSRSGCGTGDRATLTRPRIRRFPCASQSRWCLPGMMTLCAGRPSIRV